MARKVDFIFFVALIFGFGTLGTLGAIFFQEVSGLDKTYHIKMMGYSYDCNSFEMGDRIAHLSDCDYGRAYTIYNPVGMIVREGE